MRYQGIGLEKMFDFEEEIDGGDIPLKLPENYRIARYMAQIQSEQHISAEEARKHIQAQFVETLKSGTDKASAMAIGDILIEKGHGAEFIDEITHGRTQVFNGLRYSDASDIHQPTITEAMPDVIHIVAFPHRGYKLVCHDDIQLAAKYHIPHQFYDYQYLELLTQGVEYGYEFECIHTAFDKKTGYGGYINMALPEDIAKRLYGPNYEGGF